jgi:LysR family transcriptional regulator, regulator for genes of the gallate degradation pathway
MTNGALVPNLRHLRMVQMIGRLGGVSCASRQLSTSQPAVTQAVANLEAELGTALFERHATGTYATAAGREFLLRIDRFFEILEAAVHQALLEPSGYPAGRQLPHVERLITSTQIRSLIATTDTGQLNEAAARLGLSPASLHRSARTLERVLGRPLFDRSPQGPVPNITAFALASKFRRAIREIEFARGEIRLGAGQEPLEIAIGQLPMSGSYALAEATRRFLAACPNARVRIVSGDYHGLLDDLGNCRIDMIFGVLRPPEGEAEVEQEALYRDSYCVVTRPGHPLSRIADIRPEHLLDYDWVVPASGTPRRQRIDSLFDGLPRRPRFNLETSSLSTSRALLLGSDMITVMTRSEVQLDAGLGIVESLPCRYLDALPPKGVTTRAGWLPTSLHAMFLESLREVTADLHHERPLRPRIALVN